MPGQLRSWVDSHDPWSLILLGLLSPLAIPFLVLWMLGILTYLLLDAFIRESPL